MNENPVSKFVSKHVDLGDGSVVVHPCSYGGYFVNYEDAFQERWAKILTKEQLQELIGVRTFKEITK